MNMVGNGVQSGVCPVRVLGAGPAGLGIAAELGLRGVSTTLVATDPFEPWRASYGTFESCWPDGYEHVVGHRYERPVWIDTHGTPRSIQVPYLRIDTEALQAELLSRARRGNVTFLARSVDLTREVDSKDTLVIDATGRRPAEAGRHTLFQSALGVWAKVVPTNWLKSGEMLFMDLRSAADLGPPSFLYAMREGDLHFLQETTLVGAEVVPFGQLSARLNRRLGALNVNVREIVAEERCVIPMGGRPVQGRDNWLAFGASAGLTQPATGYQLARTLGLARTLADVIAGGGSDVTSQAKRARNALWPWPVRTKWALYNYGANALAQMNQAELGRFLATFCAEPDSEWTEFVDGRLSLGRALCLMARVYLKSDARLRERLFPRASLLAS